MDNPETLATLGTQDTGQINVRENRRGNQEWTIQRHWQHRTKTNKTQEHNTTQRTKKTSNTNPNKNREVNRDVHEGQAVPTFYRITAMLNYIAKKCYVKCLGNILIVILNYDNMITILTCKACEYS